MHLTLEKLERLLQVDPKFKSGCIVDTNVVFAATYPLETNNTWAHEVFELLHSAKIRIFTNINIRLEFIHLNIRAQMPESLMTFYSDFGSRLPSTLYQELKRIYSNKKRKNDSDKTYLISDPEIKDLRKIFHESMDGNSALWDEFCDSYFSPYIQSIWEDATNELKLEFIGSRKSEDNEFMQDTLEWSKTMLIIGQTAIGVSDAMIINLFNSSRLPLVITTDSDVKYCFDKMGFGSDKYILTP